MSAALPRPSFPPGDREDWERLAQEALRGRALESLVHTRADGLQIQPIEAAEGAPAARLRNPAGSWRSAQEISAPTPAAALEAVSQDLALGADAFQIVFDPATRAGLAPASLPRAALKTFRGDLLGRPGLVLRGLDDLDRALESLDLAEEEVHLLAGAGAPGLASLLFALAERRGLEIGELSGSLGMDPLGALAEAGKLGGPLRPALAAGGRLAAWCAAQAPGLRAFLADATAVHDAGGGAVDELAFALGSAHAYLEAATQAGLEVEAAAGQIAFRFAVTGDLFPEIAKLRAARRLWSQLVAAWGVPSDGETEIPMLLLGCTSRRTQTTLDRAGNLLRGTAETFAAAVGGADRIATAPYDETGGLPTERGRRLALGTQHILREESFLDRVADPGAGSGTLEALTEALARKAWARLQEIEAAGGLGRALAAGLLARSVSQVAAERRRRVLHRLQAIVGISEYPRLAEPKADSAARLGAAVDEVVANLEEEASEAEPAATAGNTAGAPAPEAVAFEEAIRRAAEGASLEDLVALLLPSAAEGARAPRLVARRDAEPFEVLRRAANTRAAPGERPRVFLATLGPLRDHRPRAEFARRLLAAGGLDVGVPGADQAERAKIPETLAHGFRESGLKTAVICGTDEAYGESAAAVAEALKTAGAAGVFLAGAPGEREASYRASGIEGFLHLGCDAEAFLRRFHALLGLDAIAEESP